MPDKVTKFIDSLDQKTRDRLKEKLKALKKNPFHGNNVKQMRGLGGNCYRLRMGKIRIIYVVIRNEIEIVDIDYRGNIY